ncbi:MAG: NADP-dependent isocitrate dehydrogenase [bacterium]|nr:NADP-dependent isocitrate dehydrogenase [bacterium]
MNQTQTKRVTVIAGDGVGPEVVNAARKIINATGIKLEWEDCEAGAEVFKKGFASGVPQDTIDSIHRNRVVLKGPLQTPVGFGEKSANVTLRKMFETYGNIRPVREMPNVPTPYVGQNVDVVVVRENVEDLYASIEHMQTPGVAQCLKLISHKGSEKIIRLAFEYARSQGRRLVHCASKANIMKLTEGLFKRVFEKVSPEYSDIEARHIIIDNCAHKLTMKPSDFDIIVTTNMNGDILSDLSSALVGGLGFAPSANIGNEVAMFEAVHGTAPDIAGQNIANPTALILSAVMMLQHIGEFEAASAIENALFVTMEEGKCLTGDVVGSKGATTDAFTGAVIDNLGKKSKHVPEREFKPMQLPDVSRHPVSVFPEKRSVIGADIFIEDDCTAGELGESLKALTVGMPLLLKMISNRGTQVFPLTDNLTDCVDHWRCRFLLDEKMTDEQADVVITDFLIRLRGKHHWMHVEKLPLIDGENGFTKAQGED